MEEFEVIMVKAAIITGNGINSDVELGKAFEMAGAESTFFPITTLLDQPKLLRDFHILGFPGGFSYGDHIGSGQVLGIL
jgi:phosphoribosylformylglycinamidine (FGAM) synthase-like amidotransferase family enzyme